MTLSGIAPGETRLAVIEVEANRFGRRTGDLMLSIPPDRDSEHPAGHPARALRIPVSVRIFP